MGSLRGDLLQHRCQSLVSLIEILNGSHDLLIGLLFTGASQLLGQICQFLCMGGIVIHHVIHQGIQLSQRRISMLMMVIMVMVMMIVTMIVVMVMLMVMLVEMVMGVGVCVIVGMLMTMRMGMSVSVVGVLVSVAVGMLMGMSVTSDVFVIHFDRFSFYFCCVRTHLLSLVYCFSISYLIQK